MLRRHLLAALAPAWGRSILVHEHILVDFAGADAIRPGRYDAEEVFRLALPKLQELRALGCRRMLECTPNYLGRDPKLLRRLARAAKMEIWTNTGLYGAGDFKYLPEYAKTETAAQLAQRWIAEWRQGVEGERVRFIKIGVNRGPLHPLDRKLVEAAILTAKTTGLTIAVHTGDGLAALEQLEMVQASGLPPGKWVWVHAQKETDHAVHERVARAGGWVEFDGVSAGAAEWHRRAVEHMARQGLLGRVLISQDTGWYHVGEPGGGKFHGYSYLFTGFLPQLERKWWKQLLWENPRAAFGA